MRLDSKWGYLKNALFQALFWALRVEREVIIEDMIRKILSREISSTIVGILLAVIVN